MQVATRDPASAKQAVAAINAVLRHYHAGWPLTKTDGPYVSFERLDDGGDRGIYYGIVRGIVCHLQLSKSS